MQASEPSIDFGTFEVSISPAQVLPESAPLLSRHYHCADPTAVQQLQESWTFVQRTSLKHLGRVVAVERLGEGELEVHTENLQTLGQWLPTFEGCPWSAEVTFQQIAGLVEVLAEAQRNHVLHRRLDVDHIYYEESSETIKLLDFSPCSLSPADDRRFSSGLKPKYTSPERKARLWVYSLQSAAKADVYSLGVLALHLIYNETAEGQTPAVLLEGLRQVPELYDLLERMLLEDPRQRSDFISLQAYILGEPTVLAEEEKVVIKPQPFPHGKVSPSKNEGKVSVSTCPRCANSFKLDSDKKRGICKNCSDAGLKSPESEIREAGSSPSSNESTAVPEALQPPVAPDPQSQPRHVKSKNPLRVTPSTAPKQLPVPEQLSDSQATQALHLPVCQKCQKTYESSIAPWRRRVYAHRSEADITEIDKYCSETCLPDVLKTPVSPVVPTNPPTVLVPAVTVLAKLPAPKAAPVHVASDPYVPGPPNYPSGGREHMKGGEPVLCVYCLKPYTVPPSPTETSANFCSKECVLRYQEKLEGEATVSRMFWKKAQESCLECARGIAGISVVVLPCGHKFCSTICGKNYLDRFFSNFPDGNRDLSLVTCFTCAKPIGAELCRSLLTQT